MSLAPRAESRPGVGAGGTADRPLEPLVEPSSEQQVERAPVVDGKPYLCLGAGIRKRAFFRIYAIGFCVEEAPARAELARYLVQSGKHAGKRDEALARALRRDPDFFEFAIDMPVAKRGEFVFLRDISAQQLRDAFRWSLLRVLGETERERVEAFVTLLDQDVKEGERMIVHTSPDGEVTLTLGQTHKVKDPKLAKGVWPTYLGPESVTPALRDSVAEGAATYAAR